MSANRFAALTGLAFIVLAVISAIVMGEPPDPSDDRSRRSSPSTRQGHRALDLRLADRAAAAVAGLLRGIPRQGAAARLGARPHALVGRAGRSDDRGVRRRVRRHDQHRPGRGRRRHTAGGGPALNALWSNDWLPFVVGGSIFMLAAGSRSFAMAACRSGWAGSRSCWQYLGDPRRLRRLPRARALWIAVASIMLFLRADEPDAPGAVPPPAQTHAASRAASPQSLCWKRPGPPGRFRLLARLRSSSRRRLAGCSGTAAGSGSRWRGRWWSCRSGPRSSWCA